MHLVIRRKPSTETETQGILEIDGQEFDSIEKPWKDNKPFESCIPAGNYILEKHTGGKYSGTYCMVNKDLKVFHLPEERNNNTDRYACVFHVANWASQLEGCIALGMGKFTAYDRRAGKVLPMVIQSKSAVSKFKVLMHNNPGPHTLRIMDAE